MRFAFDNLIYKGRVAELHSVGVRMPDGKVVQRDYVHYSGAAVILPIQEDGSVVMIRNYRFAVDERLLELPAGMLEAGEDPLVGAARAGRRDRLLGLGRIGLLGTFYSTPGVSDEKMHCFLATGLARGAQHLEGYEQIEVEIVPSERVRAMILSGAIHDAKTIGAFALYWLRQGSL